MKQTIGIACDHAGYEYKEQLISNLKDKGYLITDYGCFNTDSVDYPDFAHALAKSIKEGINQIGIQFCGSGNGINMTINKHQSIRAALCWNSEIAQLARKHNNANVCTMPARFITFEMVLEITDQFLNTDFEGGRHLRRVNKINC